jgi:hypothetical protein
VRFSFLLCLFQYFCFLKYNVIGWLVGCCSGLLPFCVGKGYKKKNTRSLYV